MCLEVKVIVNGNFVISMISESKEASHISNHVIRKKQSPANSLSVFMKQGTVIWGLMFYMLLFFYFLITNNVIIIMNNNV